MERREFLGAAGASLIGVNMIPGVRSSTTYGSRHGLAEDLDEIGELIEQKMAEYRVTGVALGLSKDGASEYRGFGITNVDNPQPITADTVFPVASISKTVTATALMRLHERGSLDIEAPVQTYLPEFRVADPLVSRDVCLWHLMTHTPGWEGQLELPDRGPESLAHFVETMADLPQLAPPGMVWSYNNAGWALAGRVIESVVGASIDDALRDLVFMPLGLDRATSRTGDAMSYRFAGGHDELDGQPTVLRPFALPPGVTGGGCAMSVENLIRFAQFHLGDGTSVSGEHVLSGELLALMQSPRMHKRPSSDQMGLGWHLRTLDGVRTLQHGGTLAGHSLHLQLLPERGLAFAILTNHRAGWKLNEDVASAILSRYEGLTLAPNQATGGNRGGSERMVTHATPLADQPQHTEYLGTYERPPLEGQYVVREEAGRVIVERGMDGWEDVYPIVFWADDMAYASEVGGGEGPWVAVPGMPIEFIRDAAGDVAWIREEGRIARKVSD